MSGYEAKQPAHQEPAAADGPINASQLNHILTEFARVQQDSLQRQLSQLQAAFSAHRAEPQAPAASSNSPSCLPSALPAKVKYAAPSTFTGKGLTNVEYWIFEMERYLDLVGVPDDRKLDVGSGYLKENAGQWWSTQASRILTWDAFKDALKARFQPLNTSHTARIQLSQLSQEGLSVNEYINKFQLILQLIHDMSEADQVHNFLRGLRPQLAQKVGLEDPKTLTAAMNLTVRIDALLDRSTYLNNSRRRYDSSPSHVSHHSPSPLTSASTASTNSSSSASTAMELGNVNTEMVENNFDGWDAEYERYLVEGDEYVPVYEGGEAGEHEKETEEEQLNAMKTGGHRAPHVTPDEFRRCMENRLCLRCKRGGHIARDCPSAPSFSSFRPHSSSSTFSFRGRPYQQSRFARPRRNF